MSVVKVGPPWSRAVFDGAARAVKFRFRSVGRFEDVKQLRLREYINPFEEEQLLNSHPEVQKAPRSAELWLDLKDGRGIHVGSAVQAGLLLMDASSAAALMGVPIVSERTHFDPTPA